ncbi:MAG: hypothetical protein HN810_00075 [Acidiferrobacteraceae bacterium]|nr:hypothetical protein [Acidiferrobacteraceae bacterium]MBT4807916.1 hypothetical protein [Acidiferrobacteraceae bacterium]MBT7182740.1 hypothetical protein [Acidiferrobacteraceae bacterium]MBT7352496.1 hypothetical protein [Acidiferrobacteraceae bacterium]
MNHATICDAVVRFSRLVTSTISNAVDELGYASIITGLRWLLPLFHRNRLTSSLVFECV